MFLRNLSLLLAAATIGGSAASQSRLLSESDKGMQMVRLLGERRLQLENLPDICTGFELLIDEIPDGRDSCTCDGISVNCIFHPECTEDQMDDPRCSDTVIYRVSFENEMISVVSCAAITEGGFEETCAEVSLAPDLQLDQCIRGTYGGKPCECDVCANRASLLLDCSAYDKRAVTDCQAAGLGELQPMVYGFNATQPPPGEEEEMDSLDGSTPIGIEESPSSAFHATFVLVAVSAVATVATVF